MLLLEPEIDVSACSHVGEGIVSVVETFTENVSVGLDQLGRFKYVEAYGNHFTSRWNGYNVSCRLHRAEALLPLNLLAEPRRLDLNHLDIEADIMSDTVGGETCEVVEAAVGELDRYAAALRLLRRDAM